MDNEEEKLSVIMKGMDVKIVWKEEEKTKVGRGQITNDDENFVYLTGEKGTVIVNRKDIIAIKTAMQHAPKGAGVDARGNWKVSL